MDRLRVKSSTASLVRRKWDRVRRRVFVLNASKDLIAVNIGLI